MAGNNQQKMESHDLHGKDLLLLRIYNNPVSGIEYNNDIVSLIYDLISKKNVSVPVPSFKFQLHCVSVTKE